MNTLVMTFTVNLEYKVALLSAERDPMEVALAMEKAIQYLANGHYFGLDAESVKFEVQSK